MSVESRLKKVEDAVGTQITVATPEEMAAAFLRGEYGPPADLFRMLTAGLQVEEGCYPEELIEYFLTLKSKRRPTCAAMKEGGNMTVKGRIEKLENVLGAEIRQEEMTIEEKMKVCSVSTMAVVSSILLAEPDLPEKEVISRFETIIKNMPIPARNVTSPG